MDSLLVAVVAFVAALLTFVSGFGLGTLLMPVMALFMPIEGAVALTAVVHLLVNMQKVLLIGTEANRDVLIKFGLTAIAGAFLGSWALTSLGAASTQQLNYQISQYHFSTTPLGLGIGCIMISFAVIELTPFVKNWKPAPRWQPIGGLFSGFLGGISGHQGAIRSAFLSGMDKTFTATSFAATSAVLACVVDLSRLSIYSLDWKQNTDGRMKLFIVSILAAWIGTWIGSKLIRKVTLPFVQRTVSTLLILLGLCLLTGWVR